MYVSDATPPTVGVLTLRGDLDFALKDSIDAMFAPLVRADVAILSFSEVSYCDSTVLAALIRLYGRMKVNGRQAELKIVAPHSAFRHVLAICGLDNVFTICETMDEATRNLADGVIVYSGTASGDEIVGAA